MESIGVSGAARFIPPGHDFAIAPLTDSMRIPIATASTARRLVVNHFQASAGAMPGSTATYRLLSDGVFTGISVTIPMDVAGQASDLVNTFAIPALQSLSLEVTKAGVSGGGVVDVEASLEVV